VKVTGTATSGSFYGWSPTCDGSSAPCQFQIGSTTNLTATFSAFAVYRPFPKGVKAIAELGSSLIAVGNDGRIAKSTDGLTWTGQALPVPSGYQLRSIAVDAGGPMTAVVGDGGAIVTSPDGTTWTARTSGTSAVLESVAYGGGNWVAVGPGGRVVRSTDGATWSASTISPAYDLFSVAYGNSTFVAVGYSGTVVTSTDGQSWTFHTPTPSGTGQNLVGVAYDGAGFVAVGNLGAVLTSSNGSDWVKQTNSVPAGGGSEVSGVAALSGKFVAITSSRTAYVSTDGGVTWPSSAVTCPSVPSYGVLRIGAAGTSFFALVEDGIYSSGDGTTWTFVAPLWTQIHGLAYGASTYVLVGYRGIYSSSDGAVWTTRWANPNVHVTSVAFGGGAFVAASDDGVWRSTDGASWTKVLDPYTGGGTVAYGGSGFVIASGGSPAGIWTSPTGETWTQRTGTLIDRPINGIVYAASKFVAVGGWDDSRIYTNADPALTAEWSSPSAPSAYQLTGVAYGNGTWAASVGGLSGQSSITSADAVTWGGPHQSPWFMGRIMGFGSGVFLTQTLLTSTDGATWAPMAAPPRGFANIYAATHNGTGWVIATNDSVDGMTQIAVHP
jgi:hypothetical protein